MKNFVSITAAFAIFLGVNSVKAEDLSSNSHVVTVSIPEVALLDLEGTTAVTLSPTAPTEAGLAFDFTTATNSSVWVNYSSVVAAQKSRNVTVQITNGSVPTGLTLTVAAGADAGAGKGTTGTSAGTITLSATAQTLISGVKSCWTGNGSSKGHNLTYALDLTSADNYSDLANANTDITITYTLTDDL